MDTREYVKEALRTWESSGDWVQDQMYMSLGICKEGGEVAQLIAKWAQHGVNFDTDDLKWELGDIIWYVTGLAYVNGVHLDTILEANIEKLRERHPTGDVKEFYDGKEGQGLGVSAAANQG